MQEHYEYLRNYCINGVIEKVDFASHCTVQYIVSCSAEVILRENWAHVIDVQCSWKVSTPKGFYIPTIPITVW